MRSTAIRHVRPKRVKVPNDPQVFPIENQRAFMDQLAQKLQLRSLNDWVSVPKFQISLNGGKQLLQLYNNNPQTLLRNLYPSHPWIFGLLFLLISFVHIIMTSLLSIITITTTTTTMDHHQGINCIFGVAGVEDLQDDKEKQRLVMGKVYHKLKLKKFEDWRTVSISQFTNAGGNLLLRVYGEDHLQTLLTSIYPNYPWTLSPVKPSPHSYFRSLSNQRCSSLLLYCTPLPSHVCVCCNSNPSN
jgi:hypothetical protein